MHLTHLLSLSIIAGFLASNSLTWASSAVQAKQSNKKRVLVYLRTNNPAGGLPLEELMYSLEPVERVVSGEAPALGALTALIAGPTESEKSKGLESPHAEHLSIERLSIKKGVARVSLRSTCGGCMRWPGTASPFRFRAAVSRTLKQFSTVQRVIICLDGYENFDSVKVPLKRCK